MTTEPTASRQVMVTFNGRPLNATLGQTVGALLVSHGIVSWRSTRGAGRPRGLFCGIGVCFDCLITVDGQPSLRACLTPVHDGMTIEGETA